MLMRGLRGTSGPRFTSPLERAKEKLWSFCSSTAPIRDWLSVVV